MTEQLKQSISALLDEEISEIEVHRLLREFDSDSSAKTAELKSTWIRFQQIRAVSQGHHHLSETQHISLHDKISAAIAEEDHHEWSGKSQSNWQKPAAGLAVAASLVVAVFLGVNTQQQTNPGNDLVTSSPTQTTGVIDTQPVSTGSVNSEEIVAFNEDDLELRELDAVKQQQLREYLMRHDRMSQLNRRTQTVTFPANGTLPAPARNGSENN